jgi:hypothetical protein
MLPIIHANNRGKMHKILKNRIIQDTLGTSENVYCVSFNYLKNCEAESIKYISFFPTISVAVFFISKDRQSERTYRIALTMATHNLQKE